jgi:hypothetical protein
MPSMKTAHFPNGLDEAARAAASTAEGPVLGGAYGGDLASLAKPGGRLNLDPDTVQHDLARLVLCLVEVVRQLMERQALRRVEGGRLTADQVEALGSTLMRLEERMTELKAHFGVTGEELSLDLQNLIDDI